MKEVRADLWSYYGNPNHVICLTTNGTIKKDGRGTMGRGCAAQAKMRVPWLPAALGQHLRVHGNHVGVLSGDTPSLIMSFPVKHNWWEKADLDLIRRSAIELSEIFLSCFPGRLFFLPRPGCGNGQLDWIRQVKPLLERCGLPDRIWIVY